MFELALGANLVVDSTGNREGGGEGGGTQDVENAWSSIWVSWIELPSAATDDSITCADVIFSVKSELFLVSWKVTLESRNKYSAIQKKRFWAENKVYYSPVDRCWSHVSLRPLNLPL